MQQLHGRLKEAEDQLQTLQLANAEQKTVSLPLHHIAVTIQCLLSNTESPVCIVQLLQGTCSLLDLLGVLVH